MVHVILQKKMIKPVIGLIIFCFIRYCFSDPGIKINDCISTLDEEGTFIIDGYNDVVDDFCKIYLTASPADLIMVSFIPEYDPCPKNIMWFDGWERENNVFVTEEYRKTPSYVTDLCNVNPGYVFYSSQNGAMLYYDKPVGNPFGIIIKHMRNVDECNVIDHDLGGKFIIRNNGRKGTCTLLAKHPSFIQILSIDISMTKDENDVTGLSDETSNIFSDCQTKDMDYISIGGSTGEGFTNLKTIRSICGRDNKAPWSIIPEIAIRCNVTKLKLVSSGKYDNYIRVSLGNIDESDDKDILNMNPDYVINC